MQESQQEYSLCVFRFFKTKKDFSKPKNARKSTRVLTVCIQMVDHIRRKCGRPLSRLLLHYHYLIMSKYQLSHRLCHHDYYYWPLSRLLLHYHNLIMSKYQLSHRHCHHDYYHWPTLGVIPSLSLFYHV